MAQDIEAQEAKSTSLARWVLVASVTAGVSYLIAVILHLNGPLIIAWKGAGVGLLALYAALRAKSRDGWQIALIMALGAAGDVVLDIEFAVGAGLFALEHLVAIQFYHQHRRSSQSVSQKLLALALFLLVPLIAWLLAGRGDVVFYALLLGAMACMAWLSHFSRYQVGLGAVLFAVSDLLIFARMGPLSGVEGVGIGVWSLYYAGQVLIATGVIRALQGQARA